MTLVRNQGRAVGLLYVLVSIPGFFGLLYVPSKVIVHGDAAATASNLATFETLFRAGITADLIGQVLFVFVALAVFDLLKSVNHRHALMMLTLILASVPIALLNEVNAMAALVLVQPPSFLLPLPQAEREALAMLFLNHRGRGFDVAQILWGLWLLPMGLLVYRSRFLPRTLGVLLGIACFAYVVNSLTALMLPPYAGVVDRWVSPLQALELLFPLWLLLKGANPQLALRRAD